MSETLPLRAHRAVRLLSEMQLQHILSFIDRNIDKDVSVSELSSELEMSSSHFSRCFKQTAGVSPHAFVARRKMQRAARLLIETDSPLEEIAGQVGFSNLGHFRRQFRKTIGRNPSDLRMAATDASTERLAKPDAGARNSLPVAGETGR